MNASNRPFAPRRPIAFAFLAGALAFNVAHAAVVPAGVPVGVDAERGDPARWYVPADTPRLKYETLVKEARAALAEELRSCRALQAGGAACVAEATAQQRRDLEAARRVLSGPLRER